MAAPMIAPLRLPVLDPIAAPAADPITAPSTASLVNELACASGGSKKDDKRITIDDLSIMVHLIYAPTRVGAKDSGFGLLSLLLRLFAGSFAKLAGIAFGLLLDMLLGLCASLLLDLAL